MNSVNLTGRITKGPELKTSKDGGSYCYFTIAVDDGKDTNGNKVTSFIDCITYKAQAEFLAKYVKKGYMLAVSGSLHTSDREDSNGNKVKRVTLKAFNVENLTPKPTEAQPTAKAQATQTAPVTSDDSELPFDI